MITRKLASNKRLRVSPRYLEKYGTPKTPEDLKIHRFLTKIRQGEPLMEWHFNIDGKRHGVVVNSVLSSNNGAQIRIWAVEGYGIALKSIWDVQAELKSKDIWLN